MSISTHQINEEANVANSETRPKAVLTYDEALENVLDDVGGNILPNWSTDDLSALLTNIMKFFFIKPYSF